MKNTLTPNEISLIKEGEKLQAIKAVHERTGLGVKEAKELVDFEQKRRGL